MRKRAKPHGAVSERFMRHHYGASGYVKKGTAVVYSHELNDRVRARISKFVLDEMERWGYNAFGIYEIVKQEMERPLIVSDNLMDGLFKQMNRCRELVKAYEEIGPVGMFGKTMIQRDITAAEKAIASGDVVQMVAAYKALEGCQ